MATAEKYPAEILDFALSVSLTFGLSWRSSISERLQTKYPDLPLAALDEIDKFVREQRDWAHALIQACCRTESPTEVETREVIRAELTWASQATLQRLWSEGEYYAHK